MNSARQLLDVERPTKVAMPLYGLVVLKIQRSFINQGEVSCCSESARVYTARAL